jgi:hypothetical protein
VDLAEWYAAGRWVGLLELIDNLPTACRLNEAIANDPIAAKYLAEMHQDRPDDADPWSPRASEYDLTATLLREAVNAIRSLTAVTIAAAGSKPGEVKPFPAPVTAIDRAMKAAARSWTEDFVQQFGFSPEDV